MQMLKSLVKKQYFECLYIN